MITVGLAGGSGSGKGVASKILAELGFVAIDTDAVYHSLTSSPCELLDALKSEFGDQIIAEDNSLNRKELAKIVFADGAEHKRRRLNSITHYYVLKETRAIIEKEKKRGTVAVLVDAPLLFESDFDKECDKVLSIISDAELRIKRIIKRDGITREGAVRRINSQISDDELIMRSDYYVINNGTYDEFKEKLICVGQKILNDKEN